MNNKMTKSVRKEDVERKWQQLDASEYNLGRLATKAAQILNGKNKVNYTPHVDMGDFLVITNAEKVNISGNKQEKKQYHHYSGYPGGLKSKSYKIVSKENPEKIIRLAIRGMMSANRLRENQLKRLKIYIGSNNPHESQFKS